MEKKISYSDVNVLDTLFIQKPVEIRMLLNLLERDPVKTVLEIGTDYGGTALIWAQLVSQRDGLVVTVDLKPHPLGLIYSSTPWRKYITEVYGDSHKISTVKKVERALGGNPVDMLFIDGDHHYKGVKKDFSSYSTFVREGGLIAFHDIRDTRFHRKYPPPVGPVEVYKFWGEIKEKYTSWEILDPHDASCMGIGVLEWRKEKS